MSRKPPDAATPLTREDAGQILDVSRETLDRLQTYLDLLTRWQRTINLVGPSTLADPWRRHILDSAQLWPLRPPGAQRFVDLGSGAGLPGLVLAILGAPEMHLVESDRRKAAFLREAARACGVAVTVHACRIEEVEPFVADGVTARALASLPELLALAERFIGAATICLFLKGRNADAELTLAQESWRIRIERRPSRTETGGHVLIISEIRRASSD